MSAAAPPRWIGIDLGASAVHAVALAGPARTPRVAGSRLFESHDLEGLVDWAAGAGRIAVDAPDELSTAPHGADGSLSPKFRRARCAEIALGRSEGIWVPWVTPDDPSRVPGWMRVGFAVWAALREAGHEPLEVYPAGVFRLLAGRVPPKKTTVTGLHERIRALSAHVALPDGIEMWSHDGVDALAAALVAAWSTDGRSRPVGHPRARCEGSGARCDGSAIWVPDLVHP